MGSNRKLASRSQLENVVQPLGEHCRDYKCHFIANAALLSFRYGIRSRIWVPIVNSLHDLSSKTSYSRSASIAEITSVISLLTPLCSASDMAYAAAYGFQS